MFCLWINEEGKKELITSKLDSTILPGVTRDSIIRLCRQWDEFLVTERKFTIDELVKAMEENRVLEVFGSGTACIVCPVAKIWYNGLDYQVPMTFGNSGELTKKLQEYILAIQHGDLRHPWAQIIPNSR